MQIDSEIQCFDSETNLDKFEFEDQIDEIERKLKAEEARYARLLKDQQLYS